MTTYYLGLKFGNDANPENVLAGTASVGGTADMELRIESAFTNRKQLIEALKVLEMFILGNGQDGAGANLPPF